MDDQALARSDTAVRFSWEDAFFLDDQLSEDERAVRDTARAHAQEKLLPRINEAYLEEISERRRCLRSCSRPTPPKCTI
jgi:glutaryl-CoA dehydrogenase